jgi:photosystem II stability/assembly factor-like uncharacterized protein
VARFVTGGFGLIAVAACVAAFGSGRAGSVAAVVRTSVGSTRLVAPGFGYSVAYRTVVSGATVHATIGLFLYRDGRWRNVTPPTLAADGIDAIDDVAFVDRRHGWVAGYSCATVAVHLYRTSDGGRSWQSLGTPTDHSCGGGPTYLSFIDHEHGWMEPVSPNAPAGELLGTSDGGRTWRQLASGPASQVRTRALPCLAPIRFVTPSTGWLARCGDGRVYATRDGGRRWSLLRIRVPAGADARFDLPTFIGKNGVLAATIGTRPAPEDARSRKVVFSVSRDGGAHWSVRSVRALASCPLSPYSATLWPTSVVDARVWWIVAGRSRPVVQVTSDAGRDWQTIAARGLPTRPCSVMSVSAANARVAWVVAQSDGARSALFQTSDGGRSWHRVNLFRR